MKYKTIMPIALLFAIVLVAGCTSTTQNPAQTANAQEFHISIENSFSNGNVSMSFAPSEIQASKGEGVRIYVNFSLPQGFNRSVTGFNGTGFNGTRLNSTRGQQPGRFNRTTAGRMPTFNIDEFNVHQQIQPGQETEIDFTPGTAGSFTYYITPGNATGTITIS